MPSCLDFIFYNGNAEECCIVFNKKLFLLIFKNQYGPCKSQWRRLEMQLI